MEDAKKVAIKALFEVARIYDSQGFSGMALDRLRQILELEPDEQVRKKTLCMMAKISERVGSFRAAARYLREVGSEWNIKKAEALELRAKLPVNPLATIKRMMQV